MKKLSPTFKRALEAEVRRLLEQGDGPVALVKNAAQDLGEAAALLHQAADALDLAARRSDDRIRERELSQLSGQVRGLAQKSIAAKSRAGALSR